ncbi:MAG: DUF6807 family protein [Gemmataceae bacterium]
MVRCAMWAGVVALAVAGNCQAQNTFEITVSAGKVDRVNTPVTVPLTVPADQAKTGLATLEAEGKTLIGQVTAPGLLSKQEGKLARELHFILPELKAGASKTYKVTLGGSASGDKFTWKDTPGKSSELSFGDHPVLRYMYEALDPKNREETYKVYHHLFDPAGKRVVTKGPGGQYTHHRGLYLGFNKITYADGKKKCDVWHCSGKAYQSHEKVLASEAGPVLGRHTLEIGWHGQEGEIFAVEERELTVYHVPGGQLVEFAARVRSADGKPIKLDGDPQHAGFQFRADQEVAAKTKGQTYYIRPDGKDKPGATKQGGDFPWKGMSFVLGEQRYTAGYLDRPGNPKPAQYSERDYGRFGSYFVYEVTKDKPLEIDYQLWLQEGEMDIPQLAARAASFAEPVQVSVKP